jgi:hypothetical protein
MTTIKRQFNDFATYSLKDKTAVSVRDGVLEYLGVELGLEPKDKIFTVYRSPATIANAAYAMAGIPLTDEHVSLDMPAPDTGSAVIDSVVIDQLDEYTSSKLAVKNKLKISDAISAVLEQKNQLSLGYFANLVEHSKWDYEQVDIVPHHLAAVESGRCGPLCSFIDRKPTGNIMKLNKAFTDAEGAASLEQIVEIAMGLPEAMKKVPIDKLQELMPAMQEIMTYAKAEGALPEEEAEVESMDEDKPEDEIKDMESEDKPMKDEEAKEDEQKFSDADLKAILDKESKRFADAEVKKYASVVNKAKNFLDSDYDYSDKASSEIMRDALATQSTYKFEDKELDIAFKLLRKSDVNYSRFGDSQYSDDPLLQRIKNDLEA